MPACGAHSSSSTEVFRCFALRLSTCVCAALATPNAEANGRPIIVHHHHA